MIIYLSRETAKHIREVATRDLATHIEYPEWSATVVGCKQVRDELLASNAGYIDVSPLVLEYILNELDRWYLETKDNTGAHTFHT